MLQKNQVKALGYAEGKHRSTPSRQTDVEELEGWFL